MPLHEYALLGAIMSVHNSKHAGDFSSTTPATNTAASSANKPAISTARALSPNHLPPTSPPSEDPPTKALPSALQRTLRVRTHHTRQREARVATHQEQTSHVMMLRSMCLRCFTCYRSHWLHCSVANATNDIFRESRRSSSQMLVSSSTRVCWLDCHPSCLVF